jgi:hypothetical protein
MVPVLLSLSRQEIGKAALCQAKTSVTGMHGRETLAGAL